MDQVSACDMAIWGHGEVWHGSSHLAWFTEKNGSLGSYGLRQNIINFHFFWKFEFLRRKVVFGYVGIVQKVEKIKKWARYWIQGISSRWLTLRLLGPAGHRQKRPLWPKPINLEIAWGSKRFDWDVNEQTGAQLGVLGSTCFQKGGHTLQETPSNLLKIRQNPTPQKKRKNNTFKACLIQVYAWPTPTTPPVQLNHIFGQFQIWDHTSIAEKWFLAT